MMGPDVSSLDLCTDLTSVSDTAAIPSDQARYGGLASQAPTKVLRVRILASGFFRMNGVSRNAVYARFAVQECVRELSLVTCGTCFVSVTVRYGAGAEPRGGVDRGQARALKTACAAISAEGHPALLDFSSSFSIRTCQAASHLHSRPLSLRKLMPSADASATTIFHQIVRAMSSAHSERVELHISRSVSGYMRI